MYQTSDIRKNLKVKMDGAPWTVVEFQFVKPGKGTAFTRTKLKNLITGQVIERNLRTGENLEPADLDHQSTTYMYQDGDSYYVMNNETYEQFPIPGDVFGSARSWIIDGMQIDVLLYEGRPVTVDLPNHVELDITYCEPAVKGDTANNATKTATMSTGATVQVPLFIADGERIRIDTRTGEYQGRVKT